MADIFLLKLARALPESSGVVLLRFGADALKASDLSGEGCRDFESFGGILVSEISSRRNMNLGFDFYLSDAEGGSLEISVIPSVYTLISFLILTSPLRTSFSLSFVFLCSPTSWRNRSTNFFLLAYSTSSVCLRRRS